MISADLYKCADRGPADCRPQEQPPVAAAESKSESEAVAATVDQPDYHNHYPSTWAESNLFLHTNKKKKKTTKAFNCADTQTDTLEHFII